MDAPNSVSATATETNSNEDLVFENALADDRKGYFFDKKIRVLSYELISPTKDGLELIESEGQIDLIISDNGEGDRPEASSQEKVKI